MRFVTLATIGVAGTPHTLISGVANQRIKVWGFTITASSTMSFNVQSGLTGTNHIGSEANTADHLQRAVGRQFLLRIWKRPWFQCDVGANLILHAESSGRFAGCIAYTLDEADMEAL